MEHTKLGIAKVIQLYGTNVWKVMTRAIQTSWHRRIVPKHEPNPDVKKHQMKPTNPNAHAYDNEPRNQEEKGSAKYRV